MSVHPFMVCLSFPSTGLHSLCISFRITATSHSGTRKLTLSQTQRLPRLPVQLWTSKLKSITLAKPRHSTSVQQPPPRRLCPVGDSNPAGLNPHAASHPIQLPADVSKSVASTGRGGRTRLYMGTAVYHFLGASCRRSNWMTSHSTRYFLYLQYEQNVSLYPESCCSMLGFCDTDTNI